MHGHPTITSFDDGDNFPYESLNELYSALATLPALESITLASFQRETRPEHESTLAHPESLTELLRIPSLRSVCFDNFSFTPALCQATANAFMEGTAVTKVKFRECSFSTLECAAMMANGFSRNTSVSRIIVVKPFDQVLCSALATALPSNLTLRHLSFHYSSIYAVERLSPVFLALGKNEGLKSLKVSVCKSVDESLCAAIKNGLGTNETLESLELNHVHLTDDNSDLWCKALSFLRTNKALKSLVVKVQDHVPESSLSAFPINIATMLQENSSLESLSIVCFKTIKGEKCIALAAALQNNTTLKKLQFHRCECLQLTDDEDKQIASLLHKNYALVPSY